MGRRKLTEDVLNIESVPIPNVSDDFGNWFAGLTDGEGHFGVVGDTSGNSFRVEFVIKLREDDEPMLRLVWKTLGFGKLYPARKTKHSITTNGRSQVKYTSTCRLDAARIVQLFSKYPLRSKKKFDFILWKEAVLELCSSFKAYDKNLMDCYRRGLVAIRFCRNNLEREALLEECGIYLDT